MQGVQTFDRAECFLRDLAEIATEEDLAEALAEVSREMGFTYFALSHHGDIRRSPQPAIRLHNYPDDWADYYYDNRLGVSGDGAIHLFAPYLWRFDLDRPNVCRPDARHFLIGEGTLPLV